MLSSVTRMFQCTSGGLLLVHTGIHWSSLVVQRKDHSFVLHATAILMTGDSNVCFLLHTVEVQVMCG